jgi:hypothetical protein
VLLQVFSFMPSSLCISTIQEFEVVFFSQGAKIDIVSSFEKYTKYRESKNVLHVFFWGVVNY